MARLAAAAARRRWCPAPVVDLVYAVDQIHWAGSMRLPRLLGPWCDVSHVESPWVAHSRVDVVRHGCFT